ncbi:MAG: preprotein translocase subunit SecG [Bacteroidetes bacterium]|nr:MAG: preprotein translocase subunit SecG [Bacteroidota bacterium]
MFFVIVLILIVAVLLVLVVLAQNSKGGGLSSQFGGSGASNIIGVKKTTDLLEKLTWGFAIAILGLSMTVNVLIDNPNSGEINSPNLDRAIPASQDLPGFEPATPPSGDGANDSNGEADPLQDLTDEN